MTTPPEDLLSAYLDDELSADDRGLVEGRLDESAEWRAVLVELRETRELVRGLPMREAPPGFIDGLLQSDDTAPVQLHGKRSHRNRIVGWIAGAAAAAAIVAVVLIPSQARVKPAVATFVNSHAARSSVSEEPVSELAPVATPVTVGR